MKSHGLADLAQSRSSFFRALEALSPGLTILVELLLRLLEPRLSAARILQRLLLRVGGHRGREYWPTMPRRAQTAY